LFPSYDVGVNLQNLPAAFYFDADGDMVKDLIVTPFATVGEDLRNVLFYKNNGTNCQNTFNYIKSTFFTDQMIDVGTSANVTFFDIDGDSKKDLIVGNDYVYNSNPALQYSSLTVYKNTGTSLNSSFEFVTNDWMNISALGQFGLSPAFGDIDGDGDDDMLLGNADGTLIYFQNNSSGSIPNFVFTNPVFQSIDVGNNSTPQIIDIDRDGKNDLLVGERSGVLNYYKNNSSSSGLNFSIQSSNFGGVNVTDQNSITGYSYPLLFDNGNGYELLVGSESGKIFHYQNIDNNLAGTFNLVDSMFQNIYEPKRLTLAMDDYNFDGYRDLMTGNGAGGVRAYQNITSNGVAINQNQDMYFEVSPNPIMYDEVLSIKFSSFFEIAQLEIRDVIGQLVKQDNINGEYVQIDMRGLNKGSYLITVKSNNKMFSKKIIKL
jgi:hypothetical protein